MVQVDAALRVQVGRHVAEFAVVGAFEIQSEASIVVRLDRSHDPVVVVRCAPAGFGGAHGDPSVRRHRAVVGRRDVSEGQVEAIRAEGVDPAGMVLFCLDVAEAVEIACESKSKPPGVTRAPVCVSFDVSERVVDGGVEVNAARSVPKRFDVAKLRVVGSVGIDSVSAVVVSNDVADRVVVFGRRPKAGVETLSGGGRVGDLLAKYVEAVARILGGRDRSRREIQGIRAVEVDSVRGVLPGRNVAEGVAVRCELDEKTGVYARSRVLVHRHVAKGVAKGGIDKEAPAPIVARDDVAEAIVV